MELADELDGEKLLLSKERAKEIVQVVNMLNPNQQNLLLQ